MSRLQTTPSSPAAIPEDCQPRRHERAEALLKLQRLHTVWWPLAIGSKDTPSDPQAAKVVVAIQERRAKLLGLDGS